MPRASRSKRTNSSSPLLTDSDSASAPDQVISAILGTREGAAEAGLQLSSIGVTWTDQVEAAVLRDALGVYKLENVMLVSAFLAATALTQSVGGAMGYDRTAVLFVEPESATLAVVETSDGSIADMYKEQIDGVSSDEVTAQLTGMVAGLEETESAPGGVLLVGSGVDIASIKPALESATSLHVSAPEEPQTALARGAALASANAPLFASSTAALAYAQDPGTGAVDPYLQPEYLSVSGVSTDAEPGDGDLAYSAVLDEDADAPTVLIDTPVRPDDSSIASQAGPAARQRVGGGRYHRGGGAGDRAGGRHPHHGRVAAHPRPKPHRASRTGARAVRTLRHPSRTRKSRRRFRWRRPGR